MKLLYGCSMLQRRMKIEKIHRNMDFIICWVEYLADGQDCRTRKKKRPIVVYKADNQGAEIKGRVVHKEKIGDMHTITVQNYGVFVVTQTNYESLKIGDEVIL
nr:MAG TPA: Protein of unknown function (DUF1372) [Caudoviricetes sp.]